MSKFKVGDEYYVFTTSGSAIYGEILLPYITIDKRKIVHKYQEDQMEQEFYFKSKNEAIDAMIYRLEKMRDD